MATCKNCGQWYDEDSGYIGSVSGIFLKNLAKAFFGPASQPKFYCCRRCHDLYNEKYNNNTETKISHENKQNVDYKDALFKIKNRYDEIYKFDDTKSKLKQYEQIVKTIRDGRFNSSCFDSFQDKEYFVKFCNDIKNECIRLDEKLNDS